MDKAVLVLDCGATNVRAVAVGANGSLLASRSLPNMVHPDPDFEGGLIWDAEEIWQKLCACSRHVISSLQNTAIGAVTVTTFGVDGAPMLKNGTLCHPVISWQCSRTVPVMNAIGKYIDPAGLSALTGLQPYHYNTINKLVWFRENRWDVLRVMKSYVMMPSIFLHRMTGEFVTDTTMAGTTMLTNVKSRKFSDIILEAIGIGTKIFPPLVEPGTVVGKIRASAAKDLGIDPGIPVVATGHDTQFAVFGSGAGINEPVLSSGTWEILMSRTPAESINIPPVSEGVTCEFDAVPGLIDLGVQWVASGVLEWITALFYGEYKDSPSRYQLMIEEAQAIPAGCCGVTMLPELFDGGFIPSKGCINGLRHDTSRAQIYRAALEALAYYTRTGLEILKKAGAFTPGSLLGVGGGTKNALWNQIRADVLQMPFKVSNRSETTVLGAALFAMPAAGLYHSVEEAVLSVENRVETFLPGAGTDAYQQLYSDFRANWLPESNL